MIFICTFILNNDRSTSSHKIFWPSQSCNDSSLHVKEGEFYSLLGPNGAGKTTTINILSSLLNADSGSIAINGKKLPDQKEEVKKIIGIVPQEISLYDDLSANDNLFFWGSLYSIPKTELKKRMGKLLSDFGLSDRANDKIKTYSGGMKRRINIACALLHDPLIVFMDEPTVGIDPQSRNNIYDTILKLKKDGKTILYTTHYMEEAERFSDRIGIMDNGVVIAEGTLDEMKKRGNIKETVIVECTSIPGDISFLHSFEKSVRDNQLLFTVDSAKAELPKILNKCFEGGIDVAHIEISKANLESVFLSLTGKKLRD